MATSVIMPKAGMSMETGTVIRWFKNVGDPVKAGEPLLEIQTDKVAMEVEAEVSGYLIAILRKPGEEVAVTEQIGFIGAKDEGVPDEGVLMEALASTKAPAAAIVPAIAPATLEAPPPLPPAAHGRVAATPAARRRAGEIGVRLESISATGREGEIRLRDVEALSLSLPGAERAPAEAASPGAVSPGATRTPLTGARKIIAHRMVQSHLTIPQFTLDTQADVTSLFALTGRIGTEAGLKISLNDFIMKATAAVLAKAPYMLRGIDAEEIVEHHVVNLGMAVALETGLIVPVIRGADRLSLSALARQSAEIVRRARERTLTPDEMTGGTFTVSNLGMYGITSFTPLINPPEGAILGVNAARTEVFLHSGQPKERKLMTLSLSVDHRVIDGAQGALFLQNLVAVLEEPYLALL